jgi:hypothetical protein
VLTDNNANATSATQTIDLDGTGTGTDKASYFTVTGPGSVSAGTSTSITVKAYDARGNLVTGYSGTVHFASSDPVAVLPSNSTLSSGTGTFSLTLNTVGTQTVAATDTSTPSVTGLVGITVNGGAAAHLGVSVPSSATAGAPFSITVYAYDASGNFTNSYNGTVQFSSTDGSATLPANSTLSSGEGNFTATLNTAGSQTIRATDTVTASITGVSSSINVGQAPAITSAASNTFIAGTSGSFTVTASGSPTPTFSETGALPSGVTLASSGVLSGTPAAGTGGNYPITITASNGVGTNATQSFTLTVHQSPAITSGSSATFTAGSAGSFTVTASGYPGPTFTETGTLPSGVTLSSNGALSGTPAAGTGGSYPLTITASNGVGTNPTQSFTLTVHQAPVVTSASSATFAVGSPGSFTVTASGSPSPTFTEAGALPSGVTLSSGGSLSGTPAAGSGGSYPLTITASNGVGANAMQSFILTVGQVPIITSASSATFIAGEAGTFTVGTTAYPTAALSESGPLPSGVTFTDNSNGTATLSGTPGASTTGSYPFTITAGNGVGPNATQSFTLTVSPPPSYVVTTATDDASGVAANCPNGGPSGGSGLNCSLRDTLAAASAAGGAAVSFDSTVFAASNSAAQNTITLGSGGTLNIPSSTTITGATSGSGATLTNLVTVSGGGSSSNFPVFTVGGSVTNAGISNLTIANGYTTAEGGGILNLGTLTVSNTTFSNNYAGGYITGGGNGGGAIYTEGTLTVVGSTFTGNSSAPGGAIGVGNGTASINSSTFTGNTALGTYAGGAIFLNGGTTVTITDSTFSGNSAGSGSAGGIDNYGTLSVTNSILSGNTGGDCLTGGNACPTNGSNGNIVGGAANLAPLGNYGGSTQTMIPLPGSAAICSINPSSATGTDQRGLPRTTTYGATTCQDSGSVQSNYAISFTTNPTATELSSAAFPAAITLTESGNTFSGANVSIPVTLSGSATLSGSPVSASTSAGIAGYSLTVTNATAVTGLQLDSTLALNSPATISAQSSSFDLNLLSAPTTTASFSPSTIVVGQTSLLTITISNPNAAALSSVQFSDTLPSGVTLVTETAGTCGTSSTGGGVVTVTPGTGSFSVTSNTLAANSSCYVTIQVKGNTVTTATDSTSTISSSNAPAGTAATATLTVNPDVTQLAFSTAPAATLTAGGNAGASVIVQEETASGTLVSTASDTITLIVTGPNSYSKSYTETAVNGAAAFNLSGAALTVTGSYSYTASISASPSVTAATASETVAAGSPASVAVVSGSGQSATIGSAFAAPLEVKVEDSNGNPVEGATVTFTAPSSGTSATLGGSPATTASDGTASVTATANGIAGTTAYAVTASVAGATSAGFTLTNTQHTTTLTVTPSPSTSVYGQPVSIVAAIAPTAVAGSSPTGTVTFYDGSTALTPASAVSSASASYTVSAPAVGSHSYAAQYGGDSNFSQSALTHAAAALVVGMANSTLSGPTSPISLTYGTGGTIEIAIAGQYSGAGIATPSGSISYTIGGGATQTAVITSGTATLNIPASQAEGTYTVAVSYNGDTNYNAATPINIGLTIGHATLTLTANNVSRIYGTANPTFTGTVTGQQNGDTFTESFSTTATLSSPVGSYAIVPSATGTNLANYTQSVTDGTLSVTQAATTTTLGVSSASITPGQNETLTAQVASTTTGTPTGTVSFYDGTSLLSTLSLSGGMASYSTTTLAPGATHILTATYSGDTNFTASSTTSSASVTVALLDFTMTISGPPSATVIPGRAVTYQVAVAPNYGSYAGTVNFAVSGLPPGATATFSPSSIPAGGGSQTVTVTIQTAPATARDRAPSAPSPGRRAAPVSLALLALIGLGGLRRRGHGLKRLLCIVALLTGGAAATFSLSGCGSGNGFFNQAPQNYTITITATAANLQHSATVMLNVQ